VRLRSGPRPRPPPPRGSNPPEPAPPLRVRGQMEQAGKSKHVSLEWRSSTSATGARAGWRGGVAADAIHASQRVNIANSSTSTCRRLRRMLIARVLAYDEDDDGFTFSRTRTKKRTQTKTAEPVPEEPEPKAAPSKSHSAELVTNQRRKNAPSQQLPENDDQPRRRRSARLSGEKAQPVAVEQPLPARKSTGRSKRVTTPPPPGQQEDDGLHVDKKRKKAGKAGASSEPEANGHGAESANGTAGNQGTKIALPFADTPVIRRNKEMRKGGGKGDRRRSSSGIRGRRASSLIESGQSNGTAPSNLSPQPSC
jgi:hypothetical protein